MSKHLILCGYPASGKTFFGRQLATILDLSFVDIDNLIEELYQQTSHQKHCCREIYQITGEENFRFLETIAIGTLKDLPDGVVALGGGSLLRPGNIEMVKRSGRLVYLDADKATIKRRIFDKGIPAFFDSSDPHGAFEKMYEERQAIYEKACDDRIDLRGKAVGQILEELHKVGLEIGEKKALTCPFEV